MAGAKNIQVVSGTAYVVSESKKKTKKKKKISPTTMELFQKDTKPGKRVPNGQCWNDLSNKILDYNTSIKQTSINLY
jgi:hypothetical protein